MVDCYVGEIRAFAGNYAPEGWALCNGAILSVQQYETLFSLIGATYGGDGQTTFALPNLCGRTPVGKGQGTGLSNYNLGQTGGAEMVTLSVANLPAHSHPVNVSTEDANTNSPAGNYLAAPVAATGTSAVVMYMPETATQFAKAPLDDNSISVSVGRGGAHTNLMPYMTISYIIALTGLYPQSN